MHVKHLPHHWVTVAAVLALAALTVTEAWGQASGASAVFEGRPAMAGAQGGTGAMAGPPTGGIGLEGSQGSKLNLRPPQAVRDANAAAAAQASAEGPIAPKGTPGPAAAATSTSAQVRADDLASTSQRDKDPGITKKAKTTSDKMRRDAKRTTEAAKYGVSPIETK